MGELKPRCGSAASSAPPEADRGLARARGTDDRYRLARRNTEIEPVERQAVRPPGRAVGRREIAHARRRQGRGEPPAGQFLAPIA